MDDTGNPTDPPDTLTEGLSATPERSSEKNIDKNFGDMSLGAWLKEQRQKKKISLEEIAAVTKIHIAQLRFLEEDQKERLPAAAFVRGFLVSYARHLHLNEDEVVLRYRRSLGEKGPVDEGAGSRVMRAARSNSQPKVRVVSSPAFGSAASNKSLDADRPNFFSMRNIAIGVAVLAVVIGIAALVAIGKRAKKPVAAATSSASVNTDPAQALAAHAPLGTAAVTPAVKSAAQLEAKSEAPATVPARGTVPAAEAPAGSKKYQLEIRALEQSWVNIRPDDQNSQGILLKGGTTTAVQADRRIILSLSDAGAVEIKWNGVWYAAPGYRGDVKSFTLPADLSQLTVRTAAKPHRVKAAAAPTDSAPAATPAATAPVEVPPTE